MDNLETIYKFNNIKLFDLKKKIFKNNSSIHNENNITHNIFNNIKASKNIYNLFHDINNFINKQLIYSIKNINNMYNIEIYFYNNHNLFFEDILKIINILNKYSINNNVNYYKNLFKLFKTYDNINIISFSININNPYYDYKMYIHTKIYDKFINDIKIIYNITNNDFNSYNNYIIEYNLLDEQINYDSFFINFNNYNELDVFINKFQESLYINLNKIIDILKDISIDPKLITFYIKFEKKILGIYLIDIDIKSLYKFFNYFKYTNLFDLNNELIKDLTFDIFINFNLITNKINDTGFFNYF